MNNKTTIEIRKLSLDPIKIFNIIIDVGSLSRNPTKRQIDSNNLPAAANEFFECVWQPWTFFVGMVLKGSVPVV